MITIVDGDKGSGKSLYTAWITAGLVYRNRKWFEKGKTKMIRPVYTNQALAQDYVNECGEYLKYWSELDAIPKMRECDLIYDDMNKDLDGQHFADTPRHFKAWLRLSEHYGVDIYGNTQDFVTLDPTVRRLTDSVVHVFKIFGSARPYKSKPEIKRIYGLIGIKDVKEEDYKREKPEREYSGFPKLMWISRAKTSLFDTSQEMHMSPPPPYKCVEVGCTNPDHKDSYGHPFKKYVHV